MMSTSPMQLSNGLIRNSTVLPVQILTTPSSLSTLATCASHIHTPFLASKECINATFVFGSYSIVLLRISDTTLSSFAAILHSRHQVQSSLKMHRLCLQYFRIFISQINDNN